MKDIEKEGYTGKHGIIAKEKALQVQDQSVIKSKLRGLYKDNRSYLKRLIISLSVIFALCFSFIFFGPMEITAYSQGSMVFSMQEAFPIMAVFSLIVCIVTAPLISLLKGKVYNYIITALFAILICGYVQGNFLNGDLGALTGDSINWQLQKKGMIGNLLLLLLLFVVPYIILYFSKKTWKKILICVSAGLVIMQSVALVTIYASGKATTKSEKGFYLTTKDEADYSSKSNTLIFILDRLDYDYIDQVLQTDPEFFKKLEGFTSYTNAISEHARTKPALNYMLTNCDLVWQIPAEEYFKKAWDYGGKNLIKDIHNQGYTIDFYTDSNTVFGSSNAVADYISNYSKNNAKINKNILVRNLCNLSLYRYTPVMMKPFFWTDTDTVNKYIYTMDDRYEIDETQYDGLDDFSVHNNAGYFKLYHFNGSHPPYTIDENGATSDTSDVVSQTKGAFNILYRAFKKMKESGAYDNSNILICGDHGDAVSDTEPMLKANRIGFFYKPAGSHRAALKHSRAPVSFKNVPATIAKAAGIEHYQKYGTPIEDVGEDDDVVRYFYKAVMGDGYEKDLYVYQIKGDAKDFENWKKIKVEHPQKNASFWQ